MSGNFLICLKGVKYHFEAQEETWDFSQDAAVERNEWDGETDICIPLTGCVLLGESLNYSLGFSFLTCELGKVTGE